MHLTRFCFVMLAYTSPMVFAVVVGGEASAIPKKTKESAPALVVTTPPTPNSEQGREPASRHVKKIGSPPSVREHQPEALQRRDQQAQTEPKLLSAKSHRRVKVSKKHVPKAVVQPRQDLAHHGLLEDSQRYDPRPNHRTAGVQNPQTPDLTHDHFQELDRNQDGKIDPVERVFGRLDMDRDLHDRQPQ
jgi:hypothetical protein